MSKIFTDNVINSKTAKLGWFYDHFQIYTRGVDGGCGEYRATGRHGVWVWSAERDCCEQSARVVQV